MTPSWNGLSKVSTRGQETTSVQIQRYLQTRPRFSFISHHSLCASKTHVNRDAWQHTGKVEFDIPALTRMFETSKFNRIHEAYRVGFYPDFFSSPLYLVPKLKFFIVFRMFCLLFFIWHFRHFCCCCCCCNGLKSKTKKHILPFLCVFPDMLC